MQKSTSILRTTRKQILAYTLAPLLVYEVPGASLPPVPGMT